MKLGAEPKKVAVLAGLLLLAGYSFYTNLLSNPAMPEEAASRTRSPQPAAAVDAGSLPSPPAAEEPRPARQLPAAGRGIAEFRPSLKPAGTEHRPDPMKVDPTLRLDLLAKLQNVSVEGGMRTLFDFSTPPPAAPAKPDPKIELKPVKDNKKSAETAKAESAQGKAAEPAKPPPPPIPLKFYGFSSPKASGGGTEKRAFFLEGDEIHVAGEGELIKRRYKVVRIGINSAIVEDIEHKHQQTLALEQPPVTG